LNEEAEERAEEPSLKIVARIFDILGSEARLKVLLSLAEGRKTWTEIMFEHKMNPKVLRDALKKLMDAGLVKKAKPFGFELTVTGSSIFKALIEPLLAPARDLKEVIDELLRSLSEG